MQTHRRRPSKSILLPRASSASWAQPAHARRPSLTTMAAAENDTHLWGYALLAATAIMFLSTLYAIIGSKFMPDTGVPVLDWIKHDEYYCLLVPITALAAIYFIMWNWMGMKFFRHN
ncbi:phosphatidylinositol N-acetylglucosaminyltransferase subunit Y-domain-containing protein [Syncephalastrum racemosum]|uniref:Phosphatidylinositol N-acetylglucosaminyltransferase subunit Y-domain-containing protein n=1 Tax=Syncephalastrum racemosum TaxID=13706 RepID=A0A1X2H1N3_SYNRA|nr:phosphatidylinositol N-acetylglucosaminyltransferase subunit Y-domain-containing protein [Syncephalastrum racemosum]